MLSKALKQITKTLGFRLTVWYSALFISSSTILFGVAFFLVSSTIREYDHQIVQTKIDEYALLDRADGLPVLIQHIRFEEENNLEAGIFIRLSDPQNKTRLLILPHQWKALDVKKLETISVPFSGEQWRTSVPRGRGDAFELFSRRLSDGSILQASKRPEKRGTPSWTSRKRKRGS